MPVRGRRRLPGRGRPDPRRRDRVRALPLPRRRRAHPPPRRAPVLQAPRPRAAAEGVPLDDAIAYAARACGACAVTNRVAYAQPREQPARPAAAGRGRARAHAAARARAPLEPPQRHRRRSARASASPPGNQRFAALCEEARRLNAELAGHRFLFDTRARRRQPRSTIDDDAASRGARRARARCASATARPGASSLFNASFQDRLVDVGVARRRGRARAGRRRPGRARVRASPRTSRTDAATARLRRLRDRAQRARRGRRARAPRAARARAGADVRRCSTSCSSGPIAPGGCDAGGAGAAIGVGARREPARRHDLRARARRRRVARLHLRTGSYANWPVLARVAPRQPAARLPAHQQELRALLRLRGPLMFDASPRPPPPAPRDRPARAAARGRSLAIRHVDAGSCNGCEHELTLADEPALRPAALRPRHRRLAPPRRRTARHRARSRRACATRCSPPTTRCPSRAASRRSATARSAAACSACRERSRPRRGRAPRRPAHPRLPADALSASPRACCRCSTVKSLASAV